METVKRTRGNPRWRYDRKAGAGFSGVVGVDEVGRGALAGPLVAAACFFPSQTYLEPRFRRHAKAIDDSKQCSPDLREKVYERLCGWREDGLTRFALGEASPLEIDNYNVVGATRLAMERALRALGVELIAAGADAEFFGRSPDLSQYPALLIDGRPLTAFPWRHTAVVKGDGTSLAIAAASILAKVSRDRQMAACDDDYETFCWAENKGYGTPAHRAALSAFGPTPLHRRSFLRKFFAAEENVEQVDLIF